MYIIVLVVLFTELGVHSQKICTGAGGDKLWNGKCYSNQGQRADWDAAEASCDTWRTGAHLLSLHSFDEEEFVISQVRTGDPSWFGLRKVSNVKKQCPLSTDLYWADGSDITYGHDHSKQCDSTCYCLAIDYSGEQWHDRGCGSGPYYALCKYILKCNNIEANDEVNVCNGHGKCYSDDLCTCDNSNYFGDDCEFFGCFGVLWNDTSVCNSQGNCTDHDQCFCEKGYYGTNCSFSVEKTCEDGVEYNGFCYANYGPSRNFTESEMFCEDVFYQSHMVSIHSASEDSFISNNVISGSSNPIWIGLKKNLTSFPCPAGSDGYQDKWSDQTNSSYAYSVSINCETNDLCLSKNVFGGWYDEYCGNKTLSTVCKYEIPYCNNIRGDDFPDFCNGRGKCIQPNFCDCEGLYYGYDCEYYDCYGIRRDLGACSSRGTCIDVDNCDCDDGYTGEACNITKCFNYMETDTQYVCSGRGECVEKDLCICQQNYAGPECEYTHPCQNDGDIYNASVGNCYHYFANRSNDDYKRSILAEGICRKWNDYNGHLVSVQSAEEEEFIRTLMWTQTWTGAEKIDATTASCPATSGYDWTDKSWGGPGSYSFDNWNVFCNDTSQWNKYIAYIPLGVKEFHDVNDMEEYAALCKAPVALCNGTSAMDVGDQVSVPVCSSKGVCWRNDTCLCYNPRDYVGKWCDLTFCDNVLSNHSYTCRGHGKCWPFNHCECWDRDYIGKFCHITYCYGVLGNLTDDVCSGNGNCWPKDKCNCNDGYFSNFCNVTSCFGVMTNDSNAEDDICNGHGNCYGLDKCNCSDHYYGDSCEKTYCYSVPSDFSHVCSGRGDCVEYQTCHCDPNYYGDRCEITKCNNVFSNDTDNICNNHGTCLAHDYCACDQIPGSIFIGEFCEPGHPCTNPGDNVYNGYCYRNFGDNGNRNESEIMCTSWRPNSHLVSINSGAEDTYIQTNLFSVGDQKSWIGLEKVLNSDGLPQYPCPPTGGYVWEDGSSQTYAKDTKSINCHTNDTCFVMNSDSSWEDMTCSNFSDIISICKYRIPICGGVTGNDPSGCKNHGWCIDDAKCHCYSTDYFDSLCNATYCHDISSKNLSFVCSGHGSCWPLERCTCQADFYGPRCSITNCFGVFSNVSSDVCSGYGNCKQKDSCLCSDGYYSSNCNITTCNGVFNNESSAFCSNHGNCFPKDECDCYTKYLGKTYPNCTCNDQTGHYGIDCDEYFDPSTPPTLNVNSSYVFIPFVVPVDITALFRRTIGDNDEILPNCGKRILNYEDYLGPSGFPAARCYWEVDGSLTTGIRYQINYDSPIYNSVPDGQKRYHPFHIHLLTTEQNVTVYLLRQGSIIAPPRPSPGDDDGDGDTGIIVGGIVGGVSGLAAGMIVLIIFGALCTTCCVVFVAILLMSFLMIITFFVGFGVICSFCCFTICCGTSTAGAGAGATIVTKEVVEEIQDEGPDFVKDAYKEKWDEKQKGGDLMVDGELAVEEEEQQSLRNRTITDELKDVRIGYQEDSEVTGGGLDLDKPIKEVELEDVGIISLGGEDINDETKLRRHKQLEEEEAEIERKRKEREEQETKQKELELKELKIREQIRKERDDTIALSLRTDYANKQIKKS